MKPTSKDFKKLQKEWYEKIKKEGFVDAEDTENPHRPLKSWHSFKFYAPDKNQKLYFISMDSAEEYYKRARHLLVDYKFDKEIHKRIWTLHSEGWSTRQIEKKISRFDKSYKRSQISNIINKIAKEII